MSGSLARIGAIVRADFLVRFRRLSTLVIFLLLGFFAYLWIPDPSTGRALIQIGDQRALYNSAAIGMATATLATIFIGLAGFYVISNAIRRDVLSRCGFVLASTTMKGSEYLLGKLAGNVVFLSTFTFGFMLTSMAMVLVRGEAPLQPLVFARQYLLLVPPMIVFVSALSIVFEAVPILRSRLGDVIYFFLWLGSLGIVASTMGSGSAPDWVRLFDYSGLAFLEEQIRQETGSTNLSIGSSDFDKSKPVYLFEGLEATPEGLMWRAGATVMPVVLLPIALLFFHRFDPARVKARGKGSRRGWLSALNRIAKPITRIAGAGRISPGPPTFARSVFTDARMTVASLPASVLLIAGFAFAATVSDANSVRTAVIPFAFAVFGVMVADVPVRDQRSGALLLVHSAPHIRERFVFWKLAAIGLVGLVFFIVPMVRMAMTGPEDLAQFAVGFLLVCSGAVALGVVSGNAKTFIVVFLTFWYLVMNDATHPPMLDFAGFYGTWNLSTLFTYLTVALLLLASAEGVHRYRLTRGS
jgi:hypothetical protein